MIIDSFNFDGNTSKLPSPALGLTGAIHLVDPEPIPSALPDVKSSKNKVYVNSGNSFVMWPAQSGRPGYQHDPGGFMGCNGVSFYPVVKAPGTTSFYPKAFERILYTFAYDEQSFPYPETFNSITLAGVSQVEVLRNVSMRLISSNTTATWRMVFECGERYDDNFEKAFTETGVVDGTNTVQISTNRISRQMQVSGLGVPSNTIVLDVGNGAIKLSKKISGTGNLALVFTSPIGPNIAGVNWLEPMLDVQFRLTDIETRSIAGIKVQRANSVISAEKLPFVGPRNLLGFQGFSTLYRELRWLPLASLPRKERWVLRVRLTGFDVEDTVEYPSGYVAYKVDPPPYTRDPVDYWPPKVEAPDWSSAAATEKEASIDSR